MKNRINLKRTITTIIGGLLFVGLSAAGISLVGKQVNVIHSVQAQEEETKSESVNLISEREYFCSDETLEGRYAVIGDGFAAFRRMPETNIRPVPCPESFTSKPTRSFPKPSRDSFPRTGGRRQRNAA